MKVLLILGLSLLSTVACFGQVYVDGVAIDTLLSPYCQLTCESATSLTRARIQIDYGQRYVDNGFNRQRIGDAKNTDLRFNSSIDALNFMARNGWELVKFMKDKDAFVYLLRRRKW